MGGCLETITEEGGLEINVTEMGTEEEGTKDELLHCSPFTGLPTCRVTGFCKITYLCIIIQLKNCTHPCISMKHYKFIS